MRIVHSTSFFSLDLLKTLILLLEEANFIIEMQNYLGMFEYLDYCF